MVTVALSLSLVIPDTLRPFIDGVPVYDHLEFEGIKNNVKCSHIPKQSHTLIVIGYCIINGYICWSLKWNLLEHHCLLSRNFY